MFTARSEEGRRSRDRSRSGCRRDGLRGHTRDRRSLPTISIEYGASYYKGTATWSNRSVAVNGSFKATGCRRIYARAFAGSTTLDFRSTSTWCDTAGPANFPLDADVVGGSDNIWVYMTDENQVHLKEKTCYRSSGSCIDGLH